LEHRRILQLKITSKQGYGVEINNN
jgi:hypothetical protein